MYENLQKFKNGKIWRTLAFSQNIILYMCSILITLVIFLTVIMRYIFKTDLYGIEEVILVIAFWLYFIGGANGSMEDSHIKADILDTFITNIKLKYGLKLIAELITVIVFIVFTKMSLDLVILNFHRMPISPGLKIPYIVTQISIALGFLLMSLYSIYYSLLYFFALKLHLSKGGRK